MIVSTNLLGSNGLEALEAESNLFKRVTLVIELNDGVSTCCFFKWTAAHGWPIGATRHGLYPNTNGSKQKVQITDGSIITRVYIPTRGAQIKEQSCIPTKNFFPAKHENVPQLTNHVKTVPKPLIRANAQLSKKNIHFSLVGSRLRPLFFLFSICNSLVHSAPS